MIPKSNPSVSVIIPVYNNALYLREAVESVLQQSFTNYEIIIVDDGSKDDIAGPMQKYLDEFKNIRLLRQENMGPGPARNTGIKMATGRWIAFLDADDLWLPEKLEKQVAYLKRLPNTLVSGRIQGLECRNDEPEMMEINPRFKEYDTKAEALTYLLKIPYVCAVCGLSSLIMSREMLDDVGVFDESLKTVEDDDLIFRLFRKYPFYSVEDVVVLRRKHSESITTGSALEPRIQNKFKVTKKFLSSIDDREIVRSKNDILGYWSEAFARRHLYWNNYFYALKWILIGVIFHPQYFTNRLRSKSVGLFTDKKS